MVQKKFWVQKDLKPKKFGSRQNLDKKKLGKRNFMSKKNLCQNKFGRKKFWVQKRFWVRKNFWVPRNFGLKKFFVDKYIILLKFFGTKCFFLASILSDQHCFVQIYFWRIDQGCYAILQFRKYASLDPNPYFSFWSMLKYTSFVVIPDITRCWIHILGKNGEEHWYIKTNLHFLPEILANFSIFEEIAAWKCDENYKKGGPWLII